MQNSGAAIIYSNTDVDLKKKSAVYEDILNWWSMNKKYVQVINLNKIVYFNEINVKKKE